MNWVGMRSNLKRGQPRDQRRSFANELLKLLFPVCICKVGRGGGVYRIRVKLQLIDDVPINVVTLMTDKDQ